MFAYLTICVVLNFGPATLTYLDAFKHCEYGLSKLQYTELVGHFSFEVIDKIFCGDKVSYS